MRPEVVYEIEGRRLVFKLDKDEITVGRDAHNDLVIEKQSISRRHAKLYRRGASWRVKDLGSLNGTRVNDLTHTDADLRDGDRILLHDFTLTFRDPSARASGLELSPRVSLTGSAGHEPDLGSGTIVQDAVAFSSLAASPRDVGRLQKLLAIVTRASEAILVSASLEETLRRVLDLVFDYLPVQRGFIMLWDEERNDLVAKSIKHRARETGPAAEIRFSRTIAEKVYRDKVAVLTTDAQADGRFAEGASVFELGIRSAMAAPLWSGDKVDGLIYVDTLQMRAFDNFDLELLSALGNHIAVAIGQSRLRDAVLEQQLVRRRLERYHSPAVVELIASSSGALGDALMADERDVTVLFADVVDFTLRCEGMEPRGIAEWLNRYFSEMAERVFQHQGTLDKFIGDCLMAVFGAPIAMKDHASRAVEAVLGMREALDLLNEPLPVEARVQFRVGMHSGRVVAGDIGSLRRSDYTVLGATVNVAARLESSVAQPGQIVISEATRSALPDSYALRFHGEHRLKGISQPVRCYELLGRT